MKKTLLHEYFKLLIESGYDSYGYYTFVDAGDLAKNAFVKPMSDFIKVFGGEVLRTASNAKLASRAVFSTLKSSFIPSFEANWKRMFGENNKEIKQIKNMPFYRDAISNVKDIVLSGDAGLVLFLYDPSYWLSTVLATSKTPEGLGKSELDFFDSVKDKKYSNLSLAGSAKKNEDLLFVDRLSKSYRKEVEGFSQDVIEELVKISRMDNESFINEYATSLGSSAYLAKEMLKNVQSLKKTDDKSIDVERASKELVKNLDALVKTAKESVKQSYILMFENQLKSFKSLPGIENSSYTKLLKEVISTLKEIKV